MPSLSLEPEFRRSHGSLYKALADGDVDSTRLRELLVAHGPAAWPLVFAVDASTWDRCDAECSPERGFHYSASKHSAGQPIVAGWSYQWITQLNWAPDCWTAPLDALRITPAMDAGDTTIEQVQRLVSLLPDDRDVSMFVFDAGYDPVALGAGLADTRAQVLVRIASTGSSTPTPAPRAPGTAGRPRRHGDRFVLADRTHVDQTRPELTTAVKRYGRRTSQAWHGCTRSCTAVGSGRHFEAPPIIHGSVIRVEVEHLPKPTGRIKTLWLWWSGPGKPDLDLCWRAYLRRFDIEHTYRFAKNTLGWTTPRSAHPEQADRWTWLIIAAHTQLRLARQLVDDLRLPWERDPTRRSSPRHGCAEGFVDLCNSRHTRQSTEIRHARPGAAQRHPKPTRTRYPAVKKAA